MSQVHHRHIEDATNIHSDLSPHGGGAIAARRPRDLDLDVQHDLDLADSYMTDTDPLLHRSTNKVSDDDLLQA